MIVARRESDQKDKTLVEEKVQTYKQVNILGKWQKLQPCLLLKEYNSLKAETRQSYNYITYRN